MKTILCALALLPLGFAAAAPVVQVGTIRTLHGKTYRQCKIVQRDAHGISFKHLNGTARVLFADLPADTRDELGYDARAAAALERSRVQERQEKLDAQRLRQKRADELRHAARLAEIKRLSSWNAALIATYYQGGGGYTGPIPAVGFAAPGWGAGAGFGYPYGGYKPHHSYRQNARGWEGVGIATIGSGSGGIYVPQSGGFIFTGQPYARYSPTLGYYNAGPYAPPPVRSLGTFGVVPGLAAPNPPAVVPGVGIRGGISMPAAR